MNAIGSHTATYFLALQVTECFMKNPAHPGRIIKDLYLDGLELSVTEAAEALGVTRPTLSRLINEKSAVSPEMAVRLSKTFSNTKPDFWMRLQLNYDLAQVEKKASRIKVGRVIKSPTLEIRP